MTLTQKQIGQWGLCWYIDPGHGWLGVPMKVVVDAGVAGQISTCSYMSKGGNVAYLEEDCDAARFLYAVGFDHQGEATIPEKMPVRGDSFVRRLPAFQAPPASPEQALRTLIQAHAATGGMLTEAHWREARRAVGMAS